MNPILNCKKKGTPFVLIRIYNPVVSGLNKINEVINTNWSNDPNKKGFICIRKTCRIENKQS